MDDVSKGEVEVLSGNRGCNGQEAYTKLESKGTKMRLPVLTKEETKERKPILPSSRWVQEYFSPHMPNGKRNDIACLHNPCCPCDPPNAHGVRATTPIVETSGVI